MPDSNNDQYLDALMLDSTGKNIISALNRISNYTSDSADSSEDTDTESNYIQSLMLDSTGQGIAEAINRIADMGVGSGGSTTPGTNTGTSAKGVYYAESYGAATSSNDCASAIQTAIDTASNAGGGTVQFSSGIYKFAGTIQMKTGVVLKGTGAGGTTLLYTGSSKFISIPIKTTEIGIRDLTLCGTQDAWADDASSITSVSGVTFGPSGTHGIYVETDPNTLLFDYSHGFYENGSSNLSNAYAHQKTIKSNRWLTNKDKSPYRTTIEQTSYENGSQGPGSTAIRRSYPADYEKNTYKNFLIENIVVIGFTGYGIYINGDNYGDYLSWVRVLNCGFGIFYAGSDAMCSNITIEGCAYEGVAFVGANMKVTNVKCIWCGMAGKANTYANASPFLSALSISNDLVTNSTAVILLGHRNTYYGIEAQDNGNLITVQLAGNNVSCYGLLIDANNFIPGIGSLANSTALRVNGCHDAKIDVALTNYNYKKTCTYGIAISYSDGVELVYTLANYNKNIVTTGTFLSIGSSVKNSIVRRAGRLTNELTGESTGGTTGGTTGGGTTEGDGTAGEETALGIEITNYSLTSDKYYNSNGINSNTNYDLYEFNTANLRGKVITVSGVKIADSKNVYCKPDVSSTEALNVRFAIEELSDGSKLYIEDFTTGYKTSSSSSKLYLTVHKGSYDNLKFYSYSGSSSNAVSGSVISGGTTGGGTTGGTTGGGSTTGGTTGSYGTKGTLSFTIDDVGETGNCSYAYPIYTKLVDAAKKYGLPTTFAVIANKLPDKTTESQYAQQLLTWQSEGHQIALHSGIQAFDNALLTDSSRTQELANYLSGYLTTLSNYGFKNFDDYVTEGGHYNPHILKATYLSGCKSAISIIKSELIASDNLATRISNTTKELAISTTSEGIPHIKRLFLNDALSTKLSSNPFEYTDLDYLKGVIDAASNSNLWICIGIHPQNPNSNTQYGNLQVLENIFSYAKSKGMDLLTVRDALKKYGKI